MEIIFKKKNGNSLFFINNNFISMYNNANLIEND